MKTYTRRDFELMTEFPMVYAFRENDAYLYIGMSIHGLARVLAPGHKSARNALKSATHVDTVLCRTATEAFALERDMIAKHQPTLNKPIGGQNKHHHSKHVFPAFRDNKKRYFANAGQPIKNKADK